MAKKKQPQPNSGSSNLRSRGLVGILAPVTPVVRDLVALAAAAQGSGVSMAAWAARTLEEAARAELTRRKIPHPE